MKYSFLLFLSLFLWCNAVLCQKISIEEFKQSLIASNSVLEENKYSLELKYSSFENVNSGPLESEYYLLKVEGPRVFLKFGADMTVQNKDVKLLVNSEKQQFILTNPDSKNSGLSALNFMQDELNWIKDIFKINQSQGTTYRVVYKKGWECLEKNYDLDSRGILRKLTILYKPVLVVEDDRKEKLTSGKLEVEVTKFESEVSFNTNEVLENFIEKVGKTYLPTAKYQGYKIIDARFKN